MISIEEIRHVAELSRLTLAPDEELRLQKDMSSILEYVGQVSQVPMPDKKEDAGLLHNIMREDAPRTESSPLYGKEEALRAAFPKREGGYNVVRKIIQKDE